MIIKILAPSAGFTGVSYNTRKIDKNKGELMKVSNFGPLQAMSDLKPKDYINYLSALSSLNSNVRLPQFHAVLSGKGRSYDKRELTEIAESWLKEMGYGTQPYLIVYHKDTANDHVHIVTSRVGRDGKKISSAYEYVRAQRGIAKVLGYDLALQYRFSTRAQFFMILESKGFAGKDPDEESIKAITDAWSADKELAAKIAARLRQHLHLPGLREVMMEKFDVELRFHSAEGKKPYGYSIIDHGNKVVFKGSEVLPLKVLLTEQADFSGDQIRDQTAVMKTDEPLEPAMFIGPVSIADDVDDQQIHGMRRRRQKKARTNTRE